MNKQINDCYISILNEELITALGCTEPIAIALAAAKARDVLGKEPKQIVVRCSRNVLKNAMGVIVPTTTNLKGVDTSAVLGALAGDASLGLEVLTNVTESDLDKTREFLSSGKCSVEVLDSESQLHIVIDEINLDEYSSVEIKDSHTNITKIVKNGDVILSNDIEQNSSNISIDRNCLNLNDILDFIESVNVEDIRELLENQIECNTKIAQEGLDNSYGVQVGRTLAKRGADDIRIYAKALASAGSDARMGGCVLPVVINSGSGNQGMTVSLPVIAFANHWDVGQEKLLRALALSNLVALWQKRGIGKLSAYCGVVSAACGSGAAITWLSGGNRPCIEKTIVNTLANVSGIVCDGAKASCAAKIASAVDAAILAHELALNELSFAPSEGIVKNNIEDTVSSIGILAKEGMKETDNVILKIMTQ